MKAALLLAFLAVANAAYFDEAVLGYDDFAPISPMLTRAMFQRFGFAKPPLDGSFVSFGRSLGASDPAILRMHALYDEPAVLFFVDPTDSVVSYYADAGVDSAILSPELRSVFPSVLGAADSMAIVYNPESFLGSYKSVLPGHFFAPSRSAGLAKIFRSGIEAFPLPVEHAIFKKSEIADIFPEVSPIYARFDIDEFPFAYKSPVSLSFLDADYHSAFPSSGYAKAVFPGTGISHVHPIFAKSPIFGGAYSPASPAYFKSGYPFIRSEIPAFHYKTPAYHYDIPAYRAAIPALKFPLVKHLSYEPLVYPEASYKILPYPVAPISAAPVVDAADSELRGFPYFLRGVPSYYPAAPALRYPAFYPATAPIAPITPIVPAASGVAGASASSVASASSKAGAGVTPLF